MNKTPVFSGPSGRQAESMPKKGDYIELKDGKRYKIFEMRGDMARIETSSGTRWADVSERILVDNPLKRMSFEEAFKNERFPVAYGAKLNDGKWGALAHFEQRRDAARRARETAKLKRKKYHQGFTEENLETYQQDVRCVSDALRRGITLEKPQGSSLHHFMDYNAAAVEPEFFKKDWQSFIVEHDWAKAFDGVTGFNDDGDIVMPFSDVVFEFRISGLRVLVFISEEKDGCLYGLVSTGVNNRWYVNAEKFQFKGGRIIGLSEMEEVPGISNDVAARFLTLLNSQIRAVCIMLDSEVAEAERQEVSHALNKARRHSGRTELKPYHIVRLHKKHREYRERGAPTGRRVRCHYRRGHWRHYELPSSGTEQVVDKDGILRSRSWINWMLVGDMDLGFVDKEYRL